MVASPAYGQCPWRLVDAKQADQRVSDALASTRPMRIGLFHSTLLEPGRKVGGVDVFVHQLGNALVERGHDVSMLTFTAKAPADANYRLHRLGRGCIARSRSRPAVALMTLTARSPSNVDVLHLHGDDWFYVGRRVPTVRTFYGSALCEARSATSTGRRVLQSMLFPLELLASRLATSSFAIADGMPAGYRLMGELSLGFTPPRLLYLQRAKPNCGWFRTGVRRPRTFAGWGIRLTPNSHASSRVLGPCVCRARMKALECRTSRQCCTGPPSLLLRTWGRTTCSGAAPD